MKALLRTLLALLLLSAWGRTVLAQAIPDNIPDVPGESPADRARERLKERHRAELSRIFVASHIAVGPMSGNDGYLVDFLVQAGIDLRGGGALHAAIQQTFLGLSIGARVRFAHRDRLK